MPDPPAPPLERILSRPEHGPRSIVHMALKEDPDRPRADASRRRPPPLKARLDRGVRSCPVKVPRPDWERVVVGTKPMFRTYAGYWRDRFARLFPEGEEFPRPAVIYSQPGHAKIYDVRLAVVTAYRQEPLGAISHADVRTEGFDSVRHFKRYWKGRYARWGWRPDDMISVVELRPWRPEDAIDQARWLLDTLYGEWL